MFLSRLVPCLGHSSTSSNFDYNLEFDILHLSSNYPSKVCLRLKTMLHRPTSSGPILSQYDFWEMESADKDLNLETVNC